MIGARASVVSSALPMNSLFWSLLIGNLLVQISYHIFLNLISQKKESNWPDQSDLPFPLDNRRGVVWSTGHYIFLVSFSLWLFFRLFFCLFSWPWEFWSQKFCRMFLNFSLSDILSWLDRGMHFCEQDHRGEVSSSCYIGGYMVSTWYYSWSKPWSYDWNDINKVIFSFSSLLVKCNSNFVQSGNGHKYPLTVEWINKFSIFIGLNTFQW